MARPENAELAAFDDIAAFLDQQREAVAIIAARQRGTLTREDYNELRTILRANEQIALQVACLRKQASERGKYSVATTHSTLRD